MERPGRFRNLICSMIAIIALLMTFNSAIAQSDRCTANELYGIFAENDKNVEVSEVRNEMLFETIHLEKVINNVNEYDGDSIIKRKMLTSLNEALSKRSYGVISNSKETAEEHLCFKYSVFNNTEEPLVIMFSQYDICSDSLDRIIFKRLFSRYGDFALYNLVCEDMIISEWTPRMPENFIKLIAPSENFEIAITDKHNNQQEMDSLLKHHLLICGPAQLDRIDSSFINNLRLKNLSYPNPSISIDADIIRQYVYPKEQ